MEQILIKNFKAIVNKEERPINVKKMTVLMGEQGSGKSTVAKLVYFFKTLGEEIMIPFTGNFSVTEENLKQMLGFLPNMKDIRKGFKGQEISLEEKLFMENSSFTKMRLINELKEKIKDLELQVEVLTSLLKKTYPLWNNEKPLS